MPTYDYVCDGCDHAFELFQGITESVKRKCPRCKKTKLRRLIGTGAGILFKGSGFYATDYRSESYKKAAESDRKASEPKDSSGGDKKSADSKSESKASKQPNPSD